MKKNISILPKNSQENLTKLANNPIDTQSQKKKESDIKPLIGITIGDFNGIGIEVIIKTFLDTRILDLCTPVIYGSSKILSYYRKNYGLHEFNFNTIHSINEVVHKRVNLINVIEKEVKIEMGKSSPVAGEVAYRCLEAAVKDIKTNKLQAIVTAPINKANMQSNEFQFPGHTEYFATSFGVKDYMMMFISDEIKIGLVTTHTPINSLAKVITKDLILSKIKILNDTLLRDFGIRKPKIAVLGLNPHAGDEGVIGTEEIDIIKPAIEQALAEGMLVFGPISSDGYFGSRNYKQFDATLAMYHDQALIPFKMLSFDTGVNFTAGLPFIRTSPDHGTGYDLAGKNMADFSSFRSALYLAIDTLYKRQEFSEISANPLKFYDKGATKEEE